MKLTGPSGRHTGRPRSRSPRRAHSPRRGRPPPFRSGLSNRSQGGPLRSPIRSTSRNSRLLSAKHSRSPPPRRHSLSPDGKRSPRKLSASRRKVTPPSSTKRRSLSPNSRRPSERGRSPRRLDSSSRSHRDASRPVSANNAGGGASKRELSPPKRGRGSLSPVPRKKEKLSSAAPTHLQSQSPITQMKDEEDTQTKDSGNYRMNNRTEPLFMESDRNRNEPTNDRERTLMMSSRRDANDLREKYPVDLDSRSRQNMSPYRRDERNEGKRYPDMRYEGSGPSFRDDNSFRDGPESNSVMYSARGDDHFDNGDRSIPYNTNDLKITVDVHRNSNRDAEPIVRRILHPEDIVIVRRPGEGSRPIFDRDEIKHGLMERGDDLDKRVVAIVRDRSRSRSPSDQISVYRQTGIDGQENFKVSRHRFESYEVQESSYAAHRPSLSDRWQQQDNDDGRDRKFDSASSCAGEKLLVSVRSRSPQPHRGPDGYKNRISEPNYRDDHPSSVRGHYNENHGNSNYEELNGSRLSRENDRRNDSYSSPRRIIPPTNPHDLRHSLLSRGRRSELMDARQHILERRERDREPSRIRGVDRRSPDNCTDSRIGFPDSRSGVDYLERDRSKEKWDNRDDSKLPDFSSRPDRYGYKEWIDKPDMVPKGPSYFEHDTRGENDFEFSRRGRGGRGGRGAGRGRPFRGRGSFRGRGRGSFDANRVKPSRGAKSGYPPYGSR